jgi:MFS family permease
VVAVNRDVLRRNVPLLYIFRMLHDVVFFAPIIVVFLNANGLSMTEVMVLQTIFSVGLIVLEVPSGFLADLAGRKITLVLGSILLTVGAAIYSIGTTFWVFTVAEIFWAVAASLISGSDTAMLYDTLVVQNRADKYKRIEGNAYSLTLAANVVATTAGGFMAAVNLRLPFYATAAFFALLVPAAFFLREPPREKGGHPRGRLYYFYKIHRFALYKNREVRWLILLGAMLMGMGTVYFWLYQPYFALCGIPLVYFGVIFGLFNLFAAASSKFAEPVERWVGRRLSVLALPSALGASALLSAFIVTPLSFLFILPAQFVRGFSAPILNDYLNRLVWSDKRATVMSIRNLFGRFMFSVTSPAIGVLADIYDVQTALIATGAVVIAFGAVLVVVMLKDRVI